MQYNKLHESIINLKNLIERMKSRSRKIALQQDVKGNAIFKNEFCTIKFSLPRRFGNTEIAIQLLGLFPKAILLEPNGVTVADAKSRIKKQKLKFENRVFQFSYLNRRNDLCTIKTVHRPSLVIVDTSTYYYNNPCHDINLMLKYDVYEINSTAFIFLG